MLVSRLVMIFGAGLLGSQTGQIFAQDYPNRPVRIVTGPSGGGGDFVSRIIAQGMSGPLGQPVIVENRASGILAAEALSKAPPDGYSLHVNGSSLWVLPLLRKLPYDVARDFSPISLLVREINVLAVHPSVPVKSVRDLIALAKAKPGELNYSSSSLGASSHLGPELLKSMAGVNIVHVPYTGTTPAITALIRGEVQMAIADSAVIKPHATSGKIRPLAVTSAEQSSLTPGLPTVAASGLPGFETTGTTGILAPSKTPDAIIKRLNQEVVRVHNLPDVKEKYFNAGVETVASSPEQFAATIKADTARWSKVIKDAGIKLD